MSHRKFEHPRHGSLGFLPRKRAARHRGKGTIGLLLFSVLYRMSNFSSISSFHGFLFLRPLAVFLIIILIWHYCSGVIRSLP